MHKVKYPLMYDKCTNFFDEEGIKVHNVVYERVTEPFTVPLTQGNNSVWAVCLNFVQSYQKVQSQTKS